MPKKPRSVEFWLQKIGELSEKLIRLSGTFGDDTYWTGQARPKRLKAHKTWHRTRNAAKKRLVEYGKTKDLLAYAKSQVDRLSSRTYKVLNASPL